MVAHFWEDLSLNKTNKQTKKNASALTQTQVPKEKKQKGVKTQRGGEKFPEGGKGHLQEEGGRRENHHSPQGTTSSVVGVWRQ